MAVIQSTQKPPCHDCFAAVVDQKSKKVTGFCPDVIADVTLGCDWPLNFARM